MCHSQHDILHGTVKISGQIETRIPRWIHNMYRGVICLRRTIRAMRWQIPRALTALPQVVNNIWRIHQTRNATVFPRLPAQRAYPLATIGIHRYNPMIRTNFQKPVRCPPQKPALDNAARRDTPYQHRHRARSNQPQVTRTTADRDRGSSC